MPSLLLAHLVSEALAWRKPDDERKKEQRKREKMKEQRKKMQMQNEDAKIETQKLCDSVRRRKMQQSGRHQSWREVRQGNQREGEQGHRLVKKKS